MHQNKHCCGPWLQDGPAITILCLLVPSACAMPLSVPVPCPSVPLCCPSWCLCAVPVSVPVLVARCPCAIPSVPCPLASLCHACWPLCSLRDVISLSPWLSHETGGHGVLLGSCKQVIVHVWLLI